MVSNAPAAITNLVADSGLPTHEAQLHQRWLLLGLIIALLIVAVVYRRRRFGTPL